MSVSLSSYVGALMSRGKDKDGLNGVVLSSGEFKDYASIMGDNRRRPETNTGNFAATFKLTERGFKGKDKSVGIRVWHAKYTESDLERYRKIGGILKDLQRDAPSDRIRFPTVDLLDPVEGHGFQLKTGLVPCVRMSWVNGVDLDKYVKRVMRTSKLTREEKRSRIRLLKNDVCRLAGFLHERGIAHGDISAGNIMVEELDDGQKLYLVDFDSFFASGLEDMRSITNGHPDWQNPRFMKIAEPSAESRRGSDFFPFLILAITLEAISSESGDEIYRRYCKEPDGSGIIIRKPDLENPNFSQIFQDLRAMTSEKLLHHLDDFDKLSSSNPEHSIDFPDSMRAGSIVPANVKGWVRVNSQTSGGLKNKRRRKWINLTRPEDLQFWLEGDEGITVGEAMRCVGETKNRTKLSKLEGGMSDAYEILVEHFGGIEKCDNELSARYAWSLFNGKDKAEARRISEYIFTTYPSDPHNGALLSRMLNDDKDWEYMKEVCDAVLKEVPSNVDANHYASKARLMLNDAEDISDAYAEAIIRTNDHWKMLNHIVFFSAERKENIEGAETFFRVMSKPMESIDKSRPGMISSLLLKGLQVTTWCPGLEGLNLVRLLIEINPEILNSEEKPPPLKFVQRNGRNFTRLLNKLKGTEWERLTGDERKKYATVLSAIGTLGTGEIISRYENTVDLGNLAQRLLSRTGAEDIDGREIRLSFKEDYQFSVMNEIGDWVPFEGEI